MTIESTDLQNSTTPAITYSECYAQVFSRLFLGDCLIESDKIESGSVDLILTDLPYGTIKGQGNSPAAKQWGFKNSEWDLAIDPKIIFNIANRILRKNGKLVLFGQEPYISKLLNEAIPNLPFGLKMIWEKDNYGSHLKCNKAPLGYFEEILIFSKTESENSTEPIRQYLKTIQSKFGINYKNTTLQKHYVDCGICKNIASARTTLKHLMDSEYDQLRYLTEKHYNELNKFINFDKTFHEIKLMTEDYKLKTQSTFNLWEGNKYKSNILKYKKDYNGYHPTQKPILLLEDLIKTFSNENNLVVDLTMGSGSTGVACKNTNRSFIGIEKDENYFKIAEQRINARTLFS
jgi:site-specific DNA-methyltransferase (adenine-specific)